ncbi:hypothetical protein HK096_000398 [Nowakowskiella sp. JEL0078]|nr:hypothetical protein HK096_000398 [Nowakowskiella sp. JEL0078]
MLEVNPNADQLSASLDSKKRFLDSLDNDSNTSSKRLRSDEKISLTHNTLYNASLISTPPTSQDTQHENIVADDISVNFSPGITSSDVHSQPSNCNEEGAPFGISFAQSLLSFQAGTPVADVSVAAPIGIVEQASAASAGFPESDLTLRGVSSETTTTSLASGEDSSIPVSEPSMFVQKPNDLSHSQQVGLVEEFSATTEGFVNSSDDDHVATHEVEIEVPNDPSVQDGDIDAEGSVIDENEVRANKEDSHQLVHSSVDSKGEKLPPLVEISSEFGTKEAQLKHCQSVVRAVKKISSSLAFRTPVDPIALHIPNYTQIITRPMDISTIEKKFKDNVYTTVEECIADFELMVNNSIVFNGSEHVVSKSGVELLKSFRTRLASAPTQKSNSKLKPKPERKDSQTNVSPRSSSFTSSIPRPKRDIQVQSSRDKGYKSHDHILQFGSSLIRELMQSKRHIEYTNVFLYPVDPVALNIPTYFDIIKRPMDLSTIRRKLDSGTYESGDEFEDDFRLMLRNCFTFNDPTSLVYGLGRKLEQVFNERWKAELESSAIVKKSKDSRRYNDSESESDEEAPVVAETVQQLQKQLASISAALAQHGSTLGSDKKRKSKSKVKSNSGFLKDSKKKQRNGSDSDNHENVRELSYKQKLDLSEKIGQLSQDDMMTAVEIIRTRSGMAVTEDIELDVDQLDRGTQIKLYKFVQRSLKEMKGPSKSATKIKKSQDSSSGSSDSDSGSDDSGSASD